jgi:hypothetical protein
MSMPENEQIGPMNAGTRLYGALVKARPAYSRGANLTQSPLDRPARPTQRTDRMPSEPESRSQEPDHKRSS